MFSKTECVGRLCPSSLDSINKPGYVNGVVLVPYIYKKGYFVGLVNDEFPHEECSDIKPFDCAETVLIRNGYESPFDITHIIFTGTYHPEKMLIFINLNEKLDHLDFVKVTPNLDVPYRSYILYVFSSGLEKIVTIHKIVAKNILENLDKKDLVNFCKTSVFQKDCSRVLKQKIEKILHRSVRKLPPMPEKFDLLGLYDILISEEDILTLAIKRNKLDILEYLLKIYKYRISGTIFIAAELNNKKAVDILLSHSEKKSVLNMGLKGAITGRHEDLAKYFIDNFDDKIDFNSLDLGYILGKYSSINLLMYLRDRKKLVGYMIGNIAEGASTEGRKDIIEYLSKDKDLDPNEIFYFALMKAINNHQLDIVKYLVMEVGVKVTKDLYEEAEYEDDEDIINFLDTQLITEDPDLLSDD